MTAHLMSAHGDSAYLSIFNPGSDGTVTDEKLRTYVRRKRCLRRTCSLWRIGSGLVLLVSHRD
jgi:hypothetical protein